MKITLLLGGALLMCLLNTFAQASPKTGVGGSSTVSYHYAEVDGIKVFYREAGDPASPAVVLLHGFPTSSFMYRDLIMTLSDRYHVIAPDLPGFGYSDSPDRAQYAYTFDHLTRTIDGLTDKLALKRYALGVFDYGAPIGWRLAVAHPDRVTAIITQNGNAYEEGLSEGWKPLQAYWKVPSLANRDALRSLLTPTTIKWLYTEGVPHPGQIAPETYTLDAALIARPGNDEIQLDLLGDYANNVKRYPEFQAYFRHYQPPILAVWGKNDPFFLPAGANAFKRDDAKAQVHFYDTGHFALETHGKEIGSEIHRFLDKVIATGH